MKKRILKGVLFFVLLASLVIGSAVWMAPPNSYKKNIEFTKSTDDHDILFLGSSHMVMAINPLQLWEEQGVTSYNFADGSQYLGVDYWMLRLAMQYHKPKVVIQDVSAIAYDRKVGPHKARLHEAFDTYKLSRTKLEAIFDLMKPEDRLEFLFPLYADHNRWSMIDASFWEKPAFGVQKGSMLDSTDDEGVVGYTDVNSLVLNETTNMIDTNTVSKDYLRKTIELCQENGIDIILTTLPCYTEGDKQDWMNSAQLIADEYGIVYWNMNHKSYWDEIGLDPRVDFYDSAHLNSSGARKITGSIGAFVAENYTIPSHENDGALVEHWNSSLTAFRAARDTKMLKQDTLQTYLLTLQANAQDAVLFIPNGEILEDAAVVPFLNNIGAKEEALDASVDCILVRKGCEAQCLNSVREGGSFETILGTFTADVTAGGTTLAVNGIPVMELTSEQAATDITRIAVLRPGTTELFDYVKFYYEKESETSAIRGE